MASVIEKINSIITPLEQVGKINEVIDRLNDESQGYQPGDNIIIEDMVITASGGKSLFDTIFKDHILTYEESKGLALQGTYVYKEPIAGERYGYPDFYNKCVEEYNEATEKIYLNDRMTRVGTDDSLVGTAGTIVYDNGVVSGIRSIEYLETDFYFWGTQDPWTFYTKVKTVANTAQGILGSAKEFKSGIALYIDANGYLNMRISSNGTSWDITTTAKGYLTSGSSDVLLKVEFTGTQYSVYENAVSASTGEFVWSRVCNVTSSTPMYHAGAHWTFCGCTIDGAWIESNIALDLKETYLERTNYATWYAAAVALKHSNGHMYYDIAVKTEVDELYNLRGIADYYGVDTTEERIFLPRNTWFMQPTTDIARVNEFVKAGLPNIEGKFTAATYSETIGGAFTKAKSGSATLNTTGGSEVNIVTFDASRSNSIYSNSNTVQPKASLKLLYYVVGNVVNEIAQTDYIDITTTTNDTVPLFTGQYFNFTPNNLSWLKAGEQVNSGTIYLSAYNTLVNCLTNNIYNLKVIETKNMVSGTDYSEYWKVNQDSQYFITPTKMNIFTENARILVEKKEPTDDDPSWYNLYSDGYYEEGGYTEVPAAGMTITYKRAFEKIVRVTLEDNTGTTSSYGQHLQLSSYTLTEMVIHGSDSNSTDKETGWWTVIGYVETSDPQTYLDNQKLYFKVANAVENLALLNAGEIMESKADRTELDGKFVNSYIELHTAATAGTYSIDISEYLPIDNYSYEILIEVRLAFTGTSNATIYSDICGDAINPLIAARVVGDGEMSINHFYLPVGLDRIITINLSANSTGFVVRAFGYRRIGNSEA